MWAQAHTGHSVAPPLIVTVVFSEKKKNPLINNAIFSSLDNIFGTITFVIFGKLLFDRLIYGHTL